jgi:RimJ/RimL family protein N-acetyltransferase
MIKLNILKNSEEEIAEVQRVLEEAPSYSLNISGKLPSPKDAKEMFSSIAPGIDYKDKFVFGIYLDNNLIGCIDLCRGYPDESNVTLGLLLLSEKYQRKGFGRQAHNKLEEIIKGWKIFEKIRIGVLITNQEVLPFWKKMGYIEKDRKPYKHGDIETEVIVLDKTIN